MKKLIALLLAACLMLGLMTTAFAADEKSNDIVILYTNDAVSYTHLDVYKRQSQNCGMVSVCSPAISLT